MSHLLLLSRCDCVEGDAPADSTVDSLIQIVLLIAAQRITAIVCLRYQQCCGESPDEAPEGHQNERVHLTGACEREVCCRDLP